MIGLDYRDDDVRYEEFSSTPYLVDLDSTLPASVIYPIRKACISARHRSMENFTCI